MGTCIGFPDAHFFCDLDGLNNQGPPIHTWGLSTCELDPKIKRKQGPHGAVCGSSPTRRTEFLGRTVQGGNPLLFPPVQCM